MACGSRPNFSLAHDVSGGERQPVPWMGDGPPRSPLRGGRCSWHQSPAPWPDSVTPDSIGATCPKYQSREMAPSPAWSPSGPKPAGLLSDVRWHLTAHLGTIRMRRPDPSGISEALSCPPGRFWE